MGLALFKGDCSLYDIIIIYEKANSERGFQGGPGRDPELEPERRAAQEQVFPSLSGAANFQHAGGAVVRLRLYKGDQAGRSLRPRLPAAAAVPQDAIVARKNL